MDMITDNIDIWTSAIKTRSSAGRGSSKKLDLYGIKKLRELILELAVRGKLVPQEPNDEPASVLLERIAAEKAQLVKEKKIKKQKPLPAITEEEKPFELPNTWEFRRFIDVLDFSGGGQPPKSVFSEEKLDGYVQLIQIRDLGPKPQPIYVPKEKVSKFCTVNDVMVGRYGASVGKVFWGKNGAYNVALIKIHNNFDAYTSGFIYLLLKSPLGQSLFGGISRSAQDGFSKNDIAPRVIPVVSLAEQHRIVAKVDELMALCDQLEQQTESSIEAHATLVETLLTTLTSSADAAELQQNWTRLADHFDTLFTTEHSIDQLKQTVLQLAVMGKLVPQDPNDEPAAILLEKIAAEKAQLIKDKKIKKQKPLPPITEDEKPFPLPEGWEWSRIGDVSLSTDYGLSLKTSKDVPGVPVLKMGNIQSGAVMLDGLQTVPDSSEGLPELYIDNRDLLYNRTNSAELVGKTGIFFGNDNEYSFASYLIRIRTLKESSLPEFLNINMASPKFRMTQINPHLKQQCGQANVNGTIMKSMIVSVAPEVEQHRIVAKVDQLMALCDQLRTRLQQAQQTQLHLADALVEQALRV